MKLLLDTHIWIWCFEQPQKISPNVAKSIADPCNDRFLSSISIWETVMLLERKRLKLSADLGLWIKKTKADLSLLEVTVDWSVAEEMRSCSLPHRDPADRMLVATARVYDLILVTADDRLISAPGVKILANK